MKCDKLTTTATTTTTTTDNGLILIRRAHFGSGELKNEFTWSWPPLFWSMSKIEVKRKKLTVKLKLKL